MILQVLTDKNFLLYAAKNYNNPTASSIDEFYEDIKRIKYIKKLITRFVETGDLKERLILNHIIVLSNVFNPTVLCRILYLKMQPQFTYVKPFLFGLGILSDRIVNVKIESSVDVNTIAMDQEIIAALRKIFTNVQQN